jgi:acetyl esterase/lipase
MCRSVFASLLVLLFYPLSDCRGVLQDSGEGGSNVIESRADAATASTTEVIYGRKMGMALTMDVIRPREQNGAAVIFVVSGGWNSGWFAPEGYKRLDLLDQLVNKGYAVILLRHGSAPLFKVPDAVGDVKTALGFLHDHCAEYGVDSGRIGVCGMSAGGHLSLMLGTNTNQEKRAGQEEENASPTKRNTAQVAAVVAYFPPTDLRRMIGPSEDFPALDFDKSQGDAVSPIVHVSPDDAPTLLVHGTKDRLVPIRHSEQIKLKFDAEGVECELLTIENAGHGFSGKDGKRATEAAYAWFEKHLNNEN